MAEKPSRCKSSAVAAKSRSRESMDLLYQLVRTPKPISCLVGVGDRNVTAASSVLRRRSGLGRERRRVDRAAARGKVRLEEDLDLRNGRLDVTVLVVEVEVLAAVDEEELLGLVGPLVGGLDLLQDLGLRADDQQQRSPRPQ